MFRNTLFAVLLCTVPMFASEPYPSVSYPPSDKPGELKYGVTFTVWIPPTSGPLRGVIVHQHGCGSGACKGGATAAYDLHWQALAKKWNCALLGPSYQQDDKQDCRQWCDPRNGSDAAFRKALTDLAKKTQRPELATVPWCLWGHSGGGFWASLMMTLHPDRVVAVWCRSGSAFSSWQKGDIPKPALSSAVYQIPVALNPGVKENGDKQFNGAWTGSLAMFDAYRTAGAPVLFAPDPRTGHECGDSRYLAIPFFDACLKLRLPEQPGTPLLVIDQSQGWLSPLNGQKASPFAVARGKPSVDQKRSLENWLPNEAVAVAWEDYVRTGAVSDSTPPPAPTQLTSTRDAGGVKLSWVCEADFDSGLSQFVVLRNGAEVGRVPEKPVGKFGRPLFQSMSYHDTPEKPLPTMTFTDKTLKAGESAGYRVVAVNGVGKSSEPSEVVTVR